MTSALSTPSLVQATIQRKNRPPYVVKACEECRRRKVRCNGVIPCRRCSRLSLSCLYRAKRQNNSQSEQTLEVSSILAELHSLKAEVEVLSTKSRGASTTSGSPPTDRLLSRLDSLGSQASFELPPKSDPIFDLSAEELWRLICVYDEHIQFIYQLVDMAGLRATARALHGTPADDESLSSIVPDDADIASLKLVVANAVAVDEQSNEDYCTALYDTIRPYLAQLADSDGLNVKAVRVYMLVSQYWHIRDNTLAAWRHVGFAVRLAEELGLNKRERVAEMFPDPQERASVEVLFWCIYVLDQSWSWRMGVHSAVRHIDYVNDIPKPEAFPWIRAMVDCSEIIGRAFTTLALSQGIVDESNACSVQEQLEPIYRELREWQSSSAVSVHFQGQDQMPSTWQLRCCRTYLYLRANDICLLLCRPMLRRRSCVEANFATLEFAAALAKDSIAVLVELHHSSSVLQTLPFTFIPFLGSALATLLLVITHQPHRFVSVEGDCGASIQAVQDLVTDLEQSSVIERKLYQICRGSFSVLACYRKVGRDSEMQSEDGPTPATPEEFAHAVSLVEPLFGRTG